MATTFLSEHDVAKRIDVSRRTLQRWRVSGEGPRFARLGQRRVAYSVTDIETWAAQHTFAHRAEEMAAAGKRARIDGKATQHAAAWNV